MHRHTHTTHTKLDMIMQCMIHFAHTADTADLGCTFGLLPHFFYESDPRCVLSARQRCGQAHAHRGHDLDGVRRALRVRTASRSTACVQRLDRKLRADCSGYAVILFLVRANALRLRTSGPFMDRFGAHPFRPFHISHVSLLRCVALPCAYVHTFG